MQDWCHQEMELEVALPGSKRRYGPECVNGKGTFELGNRAHSLCLTRNHAERGQRVKSVPSDCVMGGVTLRASIQNRLIGPSDVQTISELSCSALAVSTVLSAVKPESNRMVRL